MNAWIESSNWVADRWAAWALASSLEAAAVFAAVGLFWLATRRRLAPQVGYGLFLLVPLKLLIPPVVAVPIPPRLAAWTPANLALGRDAARPTPAATGGPTRDHGPTFMSGLSPVAQATAVPTRPTRPDLASWPGRRAVEGIAAPRPTARLGLMAAWLSVVLVLLGRLIASQVRYRRHLGRLDPVDPASFPGDLDELARRAGIGRRVRYRVDPALRSPQVWGIVRPTVVVPSRLADGLDPAQLRWVLLHELAHIRRHDLAAVGIQRLACVLNFFNPIVWVANRLIDEAREYACDDLAAVLGEASSVEAGGAFVAILRQGSGQRRRLDGALGVIGLDTRAACFRRVARLLDGERPVRVALGWPTRLALLILAVGVLPHVRAATGPGPRAPAAPAPPAEAGPLTAGGEFELTVLGPGRKPVAGALVEFRADPRPEPKQVRRGEVTDRRAYGTVVRADAEGRISIHYPEVPRGMDLSIITPGFGPYSAAWYSNEHAEIIPARFTAELEGAWSVGGVVVDPAGKPVAGAAVHPSIEFKKRPGVNRQLSIGNIVVTDAAGRWRFDSVPLSMAAVHVAIDKAAFGPFNEELPRSKYGIEPDGEPTARIALDRGLTVVGTVLDDEGRPIVGATVRTKFSNEVRKATTGPDGAYRLDGCEAKPTRSVVSAPGKAFDMRQVTVSPELEPVNFVMAPGGHVRIKVLNHEGKPEPRARIFFQGWRGEQIQYFEFDAVNGYASADGVWVWDEAPVDGFAADICPQGDGSMQLVREPIVARDDEYVFRLPPALVVSGRVIDAETKEPIRKFRVIEGGRWSNQGARPHWNDRAGFDATDGKYQVRTTRLDGTFLVRVEADGYEAATSRDVRADEGSVAVDFALKRGKGVALRLVTPDLRPAAGARVALGIEGAQIILRNGDYWAGSTFADVRTADAEGRVAFAARDQPFLLLAIHPSGSARIEVAGAGDGAREVKLDSWAAVEGTFRIGDRPAANVKLSLDPIGFDAYGPGQPNLSAHYGTTTDAEGRYRFDRVFAGDAQIRRDNVVLLGQGAAEKSSSIASRTTLAAGKTTRFDLGGTGRAVVGRFAMAPGATDPADWSFAGISGRSTNPGPDGTNPTWFSATVVGDATFRIDDLPPGAYTFSVRMQQGRQGLLTNYRFEVPPADPAIPPATVDLGTITIPKPAAP